ncbi:MAG: hypothetical protein JWR26_893 [Pedosphaera sp.]|nr:hypothetical protein [Pedosphaera sp.]
MNKNLTWKSFLLWQPMLLVSAFLTTCVVNVIIMTLFFRRPLGEAIGLFPLLLFLSVPCAIPLTFITFIIVRSSLVERKALILLFLLGSIGSGLLVHLAIYVFLATHL